MSFIRVFFIIFLCPASFLKANYSQNSSYQASSFGYQSYQEKKEKTKSDYKRKNEETKKGKQKDSKDNVISLEVVMPSHVQTSTGIDKLTHAERLALEEWLTSWTITLLGNVPSTDIAGAANDNEKSKDQKKKDGNVIKVNMKDGQYIQLQNGSIWNIVSYDRIYTFYWKPGDKITCTKGKDVLYPFVLKNESSGQTVNAQKAGKALHKDFSETYTIKSTTGSQIVLDNGAVYKVAPGAQSYVNQWQPGETIVVSKRSSSGFPVELMNGSTSRSAPAMLIQKASPASGKTKESDNGDDQSQEENQKQVNNTFVYSNKATHGKQENDVTHPNSRQNLSYNTNY